jgi:hypothetical protein
MSMTTNRFARAAASTLTAAVVGAALVAATPRPTATMINGVTFTYRISGSASQKQGGMGSSVMKVTMAGGNSRMDFQEGSVNPAMKKGGYMLIQAKEKRMLLVNPQDKAAIAMDVEGMGSMMGAALNNPMMKMTFTDSKFTYTDQGPGETILGYKTRKYASNTGFTMQMSIMGMKQKMTTSSETVSWITKDLSSLGDREAWEAWGKSFGSGMRQTNPELSKQMEAYYKEIGYGVALRTRTIGTNTDNKGKVMVDTTTMEVVDLQKANVDASMFEIPANYQITDMRQMLAPMAAAMDSAKAACAKLSEEERAQNPMCGGEGPNLKEAAKEGTKESAKDALKQGLGGLFKKKKP